MSPAVRLALCVLASLGPLAGCAPTLRFTAPTARVPVSLTGVVYDPAHRLLGERDLEPLGDISLARNLCQFPEANSEGVVDLSAPINEAVEHLGGEAVVDFQVAVHPPEGPAADRQGSTDCLAMTSSGRVVRRAPHAISLGELGDGCARRDGRYCAELARRTVAGEGVAVDVARGAQPLRPRLRSGRGARVLRRRRPLRPRRRCDREPHPGAAALRERVPRGRRRGVRAREPLGAPRAVRSSQRRAPCGHRSTTRAPPSRVMVSCARS